MRIYYSVKNISYLYGITGYNFFSQYKEACGVLPDYPTIGGEGIKDYVTKAISNTLHGNIDVPSRKFISELPVHGIKCISKI